MRLEAVLGLDIGGTNIRAGIVDEHGAMSNFIMEPSTVLFSGNKDPIDVLHGYVLKYCERFLGGELPLAVSIGFPSALSKDKTTLLSTPNLPNLNGLNVVEPLRERLEVPIFIDRDVNLLLLCDIAENKLDTSGIIIGYYVGTGLGNAVMLCGELLSGKNGVAAELGHIPIKNGREVCGCGNVGCMETVVSGRHLEEIMATHYPGEPVQEAFTKFAGDDVMTDFVDWIAIPLATEINIFDPNYIILGGGVLQMADFPVETLMRSIHRYTRKPEPDNSLKIFFSSGKQESGVIGAGIYAMQKLRKNQ